MICEGLALILPHHSCPYPSLISVDNIASHLGLTFSAVVPCPLSSQVDPWCICCWRSRLLGGRQVTPQEGGAGPARPHSMLTTPPGLGCALVQQAASPAAGRRRSRAADPGAVTQQATTGRQLLTRLHPQRTCVAPPSRLRPATTSALMLRQSMQEF